MNYKFDEILDSISNDIAHLEQLIDDIREEFNDPTLELLINELKQTMVEQKAVIESLE